MSVTTTPAPTRTAEGWCQRWRQRTPAWQHGDGPTFDPHRFLVSPIDKRTARRFVLEHHYSASWLAARLCYALIDRNADLDDYPHPHPGDLTPLGRIVGVAVLSVPQHPAVLLNPFPNLTPNYESVDLGRFVLLDPVAANGESWFLARVFRRAERDHGIRGVVAFADPVPRRHGDTLIMPGHVGWAYQGHNAIYLGRSSAGPQILLPDGTSLPGRAVSKLVGGEAGGNGVAARLVRLGAPPPGDEPPTTWLPRALSIVGAITIEHPGKHKYAWQLDRSRSARLAQPAQPYPKAPDLTELTLRATAHRPTAPAPRAGATR